MDEGNGGRRRRKALEVEWVELVEGEEKAGEVEDGGKRKNGGDEGWRDGQSGGKR